MDRWFFVLPFCRFGQAHNLAKCKFWEAKVMTMIHPFNFLEQESEFFLVLCIVMKVRKFFKLCVLCFWVFTWIIEGFEGKVLSRTDTCLNAAGIKMLDSNQYGDQYVHINVIIPMYVLHFLPEDLKLWKPWILFHHCFCCCCCCCYHLCSGCCLSLALHKLSTTTSWTPSPQNCYGNFAGILVNGSKCWCKILQEKRRGMVAMLPLAVDR